MKGKGIIITAIVCALLITAGTFGISLLYQTIFQPESLMEERSDSETGWREAKQAYGREVLYPFSCALESGVIAETDGAYLLLDSCHTRPSVYLPLLELAGLEFSDLETANVATYQYQSDTVEADRYGMQYLFHVRLPQSDGERSLIIVVDREFIPVLTLYGTEKVLYPEGDSVDVHTLGQGTLSEALFEYAGKIDDILVLQAAYNSLMIAALECLPAEEEHPAGSLRGYCAHGEWQMYSDSSMAAYVCILEDCNFVLYYDVSDGTFCGYSIAFNDLR
ncbi:MAG: hypothetical protein K2G16_08400 [Lachnospiraceae bacterium]|nr:hypothetical protein [Lachnospiraceae bacterium]